MRVQPGVLDTRPAGPLSFAAVDDASQLMYRGVGGMVFKVQRQDAAVRTALRFQSAEPFDAPIMESERFVCIPSLGSIVPGWVLITPKNPLLNSSQLRPEEKAEFSNLCVLVRREVERAYGPTCVFEHGAQTIGSSTGCGVDQAHLHVVPIPHDLIHNAIPQPMDWHEKAFSLPCDEQLGGREYLWISDWRRAFVAYPTVSVSQFFRRAVAHICDVPDQWDYRLHPFYEHIAETRRVLGSAAEVPKSRAA